MSARREFSKAYLADLAYQPGHQPCHVYVYKDPDKVPARFYHRVGLARDDDLIARS